MKKEAAQLVHPYYDALVVALDITNNKIYRVLVDTGSLVGIIFKDSQNR